MITGTSPAISALPDVEESVGLYENFELQRLRPKVYTPQNNIKIIESLPRLPDPTMATATHPDIVPFIFEVPGVEPSLAFNDFIRGTACTALMLPMNSYTPIMEALKSVAERVIEGDELPAICAEFTPNVIADQNVIFGNGEPSSWRGLLAFMQGSYWLLGYINNPNKKRGKYSPLSYVSAMVQHFGLLGYTPR